MELALLSREEVLRYSRHLLIPDVGMEGQRRLKSASALIVGTGGLGSPVALYLAAAGVGRIGIVDYDAVESSNLQRQVLHGTAMLGEPKVESARQRLLDLNPHIQVDAHLDLFTSENAENISAGYDLLIDGTDNFPTRYLINDLSVFTGRPYVYGSIFRFEGQVSVFDARSGPCYRCLFPEPPPPGSVPTCGEGGVFGVLPGTIGTLQATEALKLILGIGDPLIGRLMLYDALDMSFQAVKLRKNPRCKVCGAEPEITHLIDYEAFCGAPANDHAATAPADWDLTPKELAGRLNRKEPLVLLDVREPVEQQISSLPGARNIPYGELASRIDELDANCEIVAFCRTGVRSTRALQILQGAGFLKIHNLRGGINAWARDVDQAMLEY
jgi:sulfur-carrier protein adenylyltransferase/sulfurtransferase